MSLKALIKYKIIFCCLILISCDEIKDKTFYTRHYIEDLQRIPLIKPYELLNQPDADSNYFGTHGWNLKLLYPQPEKYVTHLNISYVNIFKGIIYGHGQDGKTSFPNYWVVIIPDKRLEKTFKNEKEWKEFLKSSGISEQDIFSVWVLFDQFKNYSTLPWYNPDRNNYP